MCERIKFRFMVRLFLGSLSTVVIHGCWLNYINLQQKYNFTCLLCRKLNFFFYQTCLILCIYTYKNLHAFICTRLTRVKYRMIQKLLLQMDLLNLKNTQTLNYTISSYNLNIHELSQNEQINHITHMCMNSSWI